jgi:hypothetical protein
VRRRSPATQKRCGNMWERAVEKAIKWVRDKVSLGGSGCLLICVTVQTDAKSRWRHGTVGLGIGTDAGISFAPTTNIAQHGVRKGFGSNEDLSVPGFDFGGDQYTTNGGDTYVGIGNPLELKIGGSGSVIFTW